MADTEAIIRRAIADPSVPRGDNYTEPLISWQARAVLAALEANGLAITDRATAESLARVAKVRKLHSEFKIYGECGHKHDGQDGSVLIQEVGYVCAAGHLYSICRECCAPGGYQTVGCVDDHDHSGRWECSTRKAVDEPVEEVAAHA